MPCKKCKGKIRNFFHNYRVVSFVETLELEAPISDAANRVLYGAAGHKIDIVVSPTKLEANRYGKASYLCACTGPGHKDIGASTTVVWGKNSRPLAALLAKEAMQPVVIIALLPEHTEGTHVWSAKAKLEAKGHRVEVVHFDGCTLRIDPESVVQQIFGVSKSAPPKKAKTETKAES